MTLTSGSGPLSPDTDGAVEPLGAGKGGRFVQPYPRRVRAMIDGRTVLDSEAGMLLYEPNKLPTLWVPASDVDVDALPDRHAVAPAPTDDGVSAALTGMVQLRFRAADRWFIEDDPVYAHFKDPYHRVDVVGSSRHVVVSYDGTVLADTVRPKLLFETGLPVRYYLPWNDVRLDLLRESATVSECPYKGDGQHWHVSVDGRRIEDAAWSLPHPLAEGAAALEHVSFYPDKVEVVVDGRRITA